MSFQKFNFPYGCVSGRHHSASTKIVHDNILKNWEIQIINAPAVIETNLCFFVLPQ